MIEINPLSSTALRTQSIKGEGLPNGSKSTIVNLLFLSVGLEIRNLHTSFNEKKHFSLTLFISADSLAAFMANSLISFM